MKKYTIAGSVVLAAAMAFGGQLRAQDTIKGPLKMQWEMTRDLVLPMANALPESKWDYKPTPEVRSFREQLSHIISENFNYMAMVAGDPAPDRSKYDKLTNHDEILKYLKDSYEYGVQALDKLTDAKAQETITARNMKVPRWTAALFNLTDNYDHYGNLVVYVRLNGVTPPRSVRATPPPAK